MRLIGMSLAGILAGLLLLPTMAAADEIEDTLQRMQERMEQLEEKLDAQDEQLSAAQERVKEQERVIQEVALAEESSSGLSRFLEMTEFGGLVAASYNYNFNEVSAGTIGGAGGPLSGGDTTSGLNPGGLGITAPFNQNPNNFQLDQVYIEMMKPATAESRGGFGLDLVFGAAADALNAIDRRDPGAVFASSDSGSGSFVYQGYASWLAPIGNGVLVQGGRFETIVGAEVLRADQNFNVTRGLVYALQPTSHTGLLLSGNITDEVSWAAGIANDYINTMADTDNDKVAMAKLKWSGEKSSISVGTVIGGNVTNPFIALPQGGGFGVGIDSDRIYMLDLVGTWDPSDKLAMWLNFDYYWTEGEGVAGNNDYWGVGLASRYAISDALGAALRAEVVGTEGSTITLGADAVVWAITGTLDYALTDQLKFNFETRYDQGDVPGSANAFFFQKSSAVPTKSSQVLALLQMMYTF